MDKVKLLFMDYKSNTHNEWKCPKCGVVHSAYWGQCLKCGSKLNAMLAEQKGDGK